MQKIAVVMSVYNGEKYLKEQVDSVLAQKGIDLELFIRVDGAKDNSASIVKEYDDSNKNVHFINRDNIVNLGVRDSFLETLKYAFEFGEFDYFSFADQDDVWLPEKLLKASELLNEADNEYKLYFSNKTFVDQNLVKISDENIKLYNDFLEALTSSLASGCTMVFNRRLCELALTQKVESSMIHDSYVYRLCKCIGGAIVFDKNSYIQYRQHGNNVCGIDTCKPYEGSISKNLKNMKQYKSWREEFFTEYNEKFSDYFTPEAKKYVYYILNYRKKFKCRFKLFFNRKVYKRGLRFTINWWAKVVLRKL